MSSLVFNERNAQQTKQNTKTTNDKNPLVSSSSSSTLNSYVANNNFHTAVWLTGWLAAWKVPRCQETQQQQQKSWERERESASANEMEGANCLTVILGQKDDARRSIPRRWGSNRWMLQNARKHIICTINIAHEVRSEMVNKQKVLTYTGCDSRTSSSSSPLSSVLLLLFCWVAPPRVIIIFYLLLRFRIPRPEAWEKVPHSGRILSPFFRFFTFRFFSFWE